MYRDHLTIRKATLEDISVLQKLIEESARGLTNQDYTVEQIEAALHGAWGVDTELIKDETYFVVEAENTIVACGGWGRRKTLFGGDGQADRVSELLDPKKDPARIRAFFVRPGWERRGIGRAILLKCEEEARASGFHKMELLATLPGHRLYRAMGYQGDDRVEYKLVNNVRIDFIPMKKDLQAQQ